MKKIYTGDGGCFQKAVINSGIGYDNVQSEMKISNGTFYRLYKKEVFTQEEKQSAATALGRTVEDIFGKDMSVKPSGSKEIIPLGKHLPVTGDLSDWQGLPMYNVPITASFVETYRDDNFYVPQYYLWDPRFRDCDFGAIITGDSMYSEIRHGDFVPCKEVTDRNFIVFGEIYYVVATNGLETCKYLNAHPTDPDCFMLVPRNEKISPSPLPKNMISKLYRVRGIIRSY